MPGEARMSKRGAPTEGRPYYCNGSVAGLIGRPGNSAPPIAVVSVAVIRIGAAVRVVAIIRIVTTVVVAAVANSIGVGDDLEFALNLRRIRRDFAVDSSATSATSA